MTDGSKEQIGAGRGPYDIDDLESGVDLTNSHLDLGSVLVPVVEGGQVTVEMTAEHQPQAVYLVTPIGRISVAAFAAPRSPGLWREVVGELVESLRNDGAEATIEDGHWGREVVATVPGAVHRFIGADGPRWMVRCVASAPAESADDLAPIARAVLSESVVRRGNDPVPPREALPIVLPQVLAEQVLAAQQEMFAAGELDADPAGTDFPGSIDSDGGGLAEQTPDLDDVDDVGALAQSARAQVVAEGDAIEVENVEAGTSAEEATVPDEQPQRRSAGSALQRLRRRQGR
ncbi:DUF3710 domain-containing protein [Williamsia sp. CHRR-6]|uniref:DUF3710 domain-containing protein n=1 Tax=Williamsia sp. CHRR-6 TaxID=2835871 RepID=UPI001BDA97D4|nr:DUF3710 domain-containing protein [Williamsia sp. CHRR-6]MBT0567944.1 DUF3710 domain-containing protein [Williamsia sp. CHRR-6]